MLSQEGILGLHDLVVHGYGPGKTQITLHAEVSAQDDLLTVHDRIDAVEHRLKKEMGCSAVIHADPIQNTDAETNARKEELREILSELDPSFEMHDFHLVNNTVPRELHFDLAVPYKYRFSDEEVLSIVEEKLSMQDGALSSYRFQIEIDHYQPKQKS